MKRTDDFYRKVCFPLRKRILSFCALFALLAALIPAALAIGPVSQPTMEGIDVSVWQGEVDFAAVRDAGVEVVYIRSSYGPQGVDRFLETNARGCQAAGLHFGFYHFLIAQTEEEAVAEARFFAGLIRPYDYDCRPVMDFETLRGMPRERVNAIAVAFLEEVERLTGHRPMVYSDANNASRVFDSSVAAYPLWVADYGPEEPDVTANWTAWTGFQYTDDGRVPGVDGRVDRDRFAREVLLTTVPPEEYNLYTVRAGDTLSAIARQYRTTVAELVKRNDIADPNLIYVGQVLRLPKQAEGYVLYPVVRGDTLSALARQYHTTVTALVDLNGIANPNLIYVGQILRIPA